MGSPYRPVAGSRSPHSRQPAAGKQAWMENSWFLALHSHVLGVVGAIGNFFAAEKELPQRFSIFDRSFGTMG
jgi:hypothetical protein